jgi:hypothetical protein
LSFVQIDEWYTFLRNFSLLEPTTLLIRNPVNEKGRNMRLQMIEMVRLENAKIAAIIVSR